MSFLRKMFSGGASPDDPRRWVIESMLAAMASDGEVLEDELEVLQKNIDEHELFSGLTQEASSRLIDIAADAIRESGGGAARAPTIAKGIPSRNHRLAAYAMACEVCVADSELAEGEIAYLEALQTAFGIGDDEARELFEAARADSGLLTLEEKTMRMRGLLPHFVRCMALMAAADGEIHDEELVGVTAVLRNIPDMAVLSKDEFEDVIVEAFESIKGRQPEQALEEFAAQIENPADRYWTAVYMMIIALADGKEDWREITFLGAVSKSFGLNDEQMDQALATARMFPATELGGEAPV